MPMSKPSVEPYVVPFTILIDSNEGSPFCFDGFKADARHQYRPLVVNVRWCKLGRVGESIGDYSIEGYADRIGVERKSIDDVFSTVLGWESDHEKDRSLLGRRERFKLQLANMATLDAALVVVEASLGTCLQQIPSYGVKSVSENRKIFNRSILSMMQDYHVPWLFCDDRRLAEMETFRFLERFWRKDQEKKKEEMKSLKNVGGEDLAL